MGNLFKLNDVYRSHLYHRIVALLCGCILHLIVSGCVGTVEDAGDKITDTSEGLNPTLSFNGIDEAIAISHNRIEVYFNAASGGSGDFSYRIHYSDERIPFSIDGEALYRTFNGRLMYTMVLAETDQGKGFLISVDVIDDISGEELITLNSEQATLFANKVGDYTGMLGVQNLSGVDGLTRLKINLGYAYKKPHLGTLPEHPKTYEIIAIDANRLLPADMDNGSLTAGDGRYIFTVDYKDSLLETTISGLEENTPYYLRSRVLHQGSIQDPNNINLRGERNNLLFEAQTLDPNASNINYDPASLVLVANSGTAGKTAAVASWGEASNGIFDHFRLYWTPSPGTINLSLLASDCTKNGAEVGVSGIFCKEIEVTQLSTQVTGLSQATEYLFVLAICLNNTCSTRLLYDQVIYDTTTVLPAFSGIVSIRYAESFGELGKLFLQINPPDISQSFYDGYIVKFGTVDSDPGAVELEIENGVNTPYGVQSLSHYDFLTANEIAVNGVDYASTSTWCYTVHLFYYDSVGVKVESPNNVWRCVQPQVVAPSNVEFSGISTAQVSDSEVILTFNTPSSGVFEFFEVFITSTAPSFSFSDAITDTTVNFTFTNYNRFLFPGIVAGVPTTGITLYGLQNGVYDVGILTYVSVGTGDIRSEINSSVFQCTVVGAGAASCAAN